MGSIQDFTVPLTEIKRIGQGLSRPENVLAFRDGTVFTSSNRGYITCIRPDGSQYTIGNIPRGEPASMAVESEESLLVNNTSDGKLYRLYLDGRHEIVLETVAGRPVGNINYVFRDSQGRTWLAISTRRTPPFAEYRLQADGYVVLLDDNGPHIVADGLLFPNEIKLNASETHAYISESNGRRIIRFRIEHDGTLADRESVGPDPLGETAFPDGFALDAEGNVWATIVTQNSLVIITPHGDIHTVFADPNPKAAPALLEAYGSGVMPVRLLGATAGPTIQLPTSVAFGGPDLQTVYMGSLAMPYLLSFRSPVPGLPLQHQHPDHPMLKNLLHIGR